MKMLVRTLALAACAISGSAYAICENNPTPGCRIAALESADQQLNVVFKRLLASASPDRERQLRETQRTWIEMRNRNCGLARASAVSKDWLAKVAQDTGKATCVHDTTMARVSELQEVPTANDENDLIEKQEYTFPASRNAGKLYAEVVLFVKGAEQGGPVTTTMQIGVSDSRSMVGMQFDVAQVAKKALPSGEYVVGLAIDLDNGKIYYSENGQWRVTPGLSEGDDLKRGKQYAIRVNTPGRLMSSFLRFNAVRINTGNEPFKFATPPGYEPYYKAPANIAGGSRLDWIVPIYLKVANKSLSQWADRYWAWLLAKKSDRNPVTDSTGAFCGDGQTGPVWFLASGDAKSQIVRSCTIPRGKYLLLPAIANLIYSTIGRMPCATIESENIPAVGASNIYSVFVSIDGQRFDSLYDNRVFTEKCSTIRGDVGETVARDVVYFGAWILLEPLPPGEHTVSFGGNLDDIQEKRAVTYRLRVE